MSKTKTRCSEIIVIAGSNGSGKTTITSEIDIINNYINADDIKKEYDIFLSFNIGKGIF